MDPADTANNWRTVEDGPFAGWLVWAGAISPFEAVTGPYHFRVDEHGIARGSFLPEERHMNAVDVVHGGALTTFADAMAASAVGLTLDGQAAITVTLNSEFTGAGRAGSPIDAIARVVHATRSMVFVQGQLEQNGDPILAFSSTLKRIDPRA